MVNPPGGLGQPAWRTWPARLEDLASPPGGLGHTWNNTLIYVGGWDAAVCGRMECCLPGISRIQKFQSVTNVIISSVRRKYPENTINTKVVSLSLKFPLSQDATLPEYPCIQILWCGESDRLANIFIS